MVTRYTKPLLPWSLPWALIQIKESEKTSSLRRWHFSWNLKWRAFLTTTINSQQRGHSRQKNCFKSKGPAPGLSPTHLSNRKSQWGENLESKALQDAYLKGLTLGPYITCHYNHPFQWSQLVPFYRQEVWSRRVMARTFLKPRYGRPKQSDSRASALKYHSYWASKDPYNPHKCFLSLLDWDFLCKDLFFYFPSWPLFYCTLYTTPLEHLSYILMTCWLASLSSRLQTPSLQYFHL